MFENIQDIIDYYSDEEVKNNEKVTTESSERLSKLCN